MFRKYIIIILIATVYYFGITSLILVITKNKTGTNDYPSNDYNLPKEWQKIELVEQLDTYADQKILIITNRPFIPDASNKVYFPNEIAKYRKVSYLIAFFNGKDWKITPVKNLQTGIDAINCGKSFLLFVHGHGKNFITALNRSYRIKQRYDLSMILFDWPSRNSNFNRSLVNVRKCGENFYNLILELDDYKNRYFSNDQKLTMFCHSLGNYFVSHLVVNGNNQYINSPIFDNLVLNAPAIKAKGHNEIINQLNISKRIYITSNLNDRVLRGANLITAGKMLGNYIKPPLAKQALYINFTEIAGQEHTSFAGYHEYEYSNPVVFNVYNSLLLGYELDTRELKEENPINIFTINPSHN